MPDSDPQQEDASTPAQEQQQATPPPEQSAPVPDESQNPDQYLNWSSRSHDPKDIEHK